MASPDDDDSEDKVVVDDVRSALNAAIQEAETEKPADGAEESGARASTRASDGKFARAEGDTETAATPKPDAVADSPKPDAATGETPATEAKSAEPPAHWSAGDKEAFKELTAKAQSAWLRRDQEMTADYTKKTQEIAAFRRDYEPVAQILGPYAEQIRAKGFTPASLIKAWSDVELALADPVRAPSVVSDLIRTYKIDPATLARSLGLQIAPRADGDPPPPTGSAPIQLPPELAAKIETLEQSSRRYEESLVAQQRQQRSAEEGRVMSTITAFRDAVDANGKQLHPHYDELEPEMIGLLTAARASGREPTLDQLYDTAVWANTSTRGKVLADQRAAEEAQRAAADKATRDEARAKAERAKRAASPITGSPAPGQSRSASRNGDASLRDILLAAVEEHADA